MGVTNPETIETRLRRVIIRDLVPSPSVDPLGNVTYLFFLLRNQIENPLTDQLVDWLNSWVDRVINRAETGRIEDKVERPACLACLRERLLLRGDVDAAELLDQLGVAVRLLRERVDGQLEPA